MVVRKSFILLFGVGLLAAVGLLIIPGLVDADDYQKMLKQNEQQAADQFRSQLTAPAPTPQTASPQNQAQGAATAAPVTPPATDAQKAFAPNSQASANAPAAQQPPANNPWLKSNPWAAQAKTNPWANQSYPPAPGTTTPAGPSPQQAQSALPQPPNIFASPQTASPSAAPADDSKSAAPAQNQSH